MTSRYRYDALTNWAMKPWKIELAIKWVDTISWQEKSVVRASHRYRDVMGSNPVEALNFSGLQAIA